MNRRAFLRGGTALGLAALAPSRGLPAEIAAPVATPASGMAVLVENANTAHAEIMAMISQKMLECVRNRMPHLERWQREIMQSGTNTFTRHFGESPVVTFRRPVAFQVHPVEFGPEYLAMMEAELMAEAQP